MASYVAPLIGTAAVQGPTAKPDSNAQVATNNPDGSFVGWATPLAADANGDITFGGTTRYDASEDRLYARQPYFGIGISIGATNNPSIVSVPSYGIAIVSPTIQESLYFALPGGNGSVSTPACRVQRPSGFGWRTGLAWQGAADTGFLSPSAGVIRAAHSASSIDNLQVGYCEFWSVTSTTTPREVGSVTPSWAVSTDASRIGRLVHTVEDWAGSRETFREESDGTQAMIGFLGADAVARPTVTGSWSDGTAGASLAAALASLGLITDETEA